MFEQDDIQSLLHQSRQYNAQVGITGVLLYIRGHIIQVLEGDKTAVKDLFARIKLDPRHTQVTCVLNKSIDERLFSEWSMGYQTLTGEQFEAVNSITDLAKAEPQPGKEHEAAIIKTLKAFYRINHQP
jgi:hypothetical protein